MMPLYKATHIPYGVTDPSQRTIRNPGINDEVEFMKYGIETGGEYFEVRAVVKPGGGVPIHRHYGYGETFFPIKGELGVVGHNGTKKMTLHKDGNDSYTVKPGEWHRFFNPSETEDIVFDARVNPAHQGFEKTVHLLYGLANDGLGDETGFPKSFVHQMIFPWLGEVGYPGAFGWMIAICSRVVGWYARLSGEEERLTRRYYGRPIEEADKVKWKLA